MLCAATLLVAPSAHAHKPSDSYLTLVAQEDHVLVRWDVALRDLDAELGLDLNDDGSLSWGEVRLRAADIAAFVMPRLRVQAQQTACATVDSTTIATKPMTSLPTSSMRPEPAPQVHQTAEAISVNSAVSMSLAAHSDGVYAVLQYRLQCAAPANTLQVDYRLFAESDPTHRGIVRAVWTQSGSPGGSQGVLAVLGPDAPRHSFAHTSSSRSATLRAFIEEGIRHIWLGFDHVLFLLTLLLPSVLLAQGQKNVRRSDLNIAIFDVLSVVTAFTLAHSLTLTLAVLDWVTLPSRVVESGIAITVLLGALNNLRPVLWRKRWIAAFVFGLIHGFGFAGALKSLNLAMGDLALSLFGFNLGVEIGQLVIVAVFVPLAFSLRRTTFYRVGLLRGGSIAIALIAAIWFVERALDIKLVTR